MAILLFERIPLHLYPIFFSLVLIGLCYHSGAAVLVLSKVRGLRPVVLYGLQVVLCVCVENVLTCLMNYLHVAVLVEFDIRNWLGLNFLYV
jgi:hypothetical protein